MLIRYHKALSAWFSEHISSSQRCCWIQGTDYKSFQQKGAAWYEVQTTNHWLHELVLSATILAWDFCNLVSVLWKLSVWNEENTQERSKHILNTRKLKHQIFTATYDTATYWSKLKLSSKLFWNMIRRTNSEAISSWAKAKIGNCNELNKFGDHNSGQSLGDKNLK